MVRDPREPRGACEHKRYETWYPAMPLPAAARPPPFPLLADAAADADLRGEFDEDGDADGYGDRYMDVIITGEVRAGGACLSGRRR